MTQEKKYTPEEPALILAQHAKWARGEPGGTRANLTRANLTGADLTGAYLTRAKIQPSTILDTGETWKEYLEQVVPALLTAGGKTIKQIVAEKAWDCHDWDNCPMACAFGVKHEEETPLLLRPRVRQFVRFFDARLIPEPVASEP